MKRVGLWVAVGALIFGSALPALAQQQAAPPAFTVTFGGAFRLLGIAFDNLKDFQDTSGATNKDSEAFWHERWRLFTTVESADKNAKVYWAIEVGDLTGGKGGGASGAEFGGVTARSGNNTGAGLGADGVNVETKNIWVQFNIPGVPGASLQAGIANIAFLNNPIGAFNDDDAFSIQLRWKGDPVDIHLYTAKADENNNQDADDNDFYVARVGVNITKDLRVTAEGMVVNAQCFARRPVTTTTPTPVIGGPTVGTTTTANTGTCVDADFGDNFWGGFTVGAKIGTINLDGQFVYGKRALFSNTLGRNIEESGWGVLAVARMPVGPVNVHAQGWYTTGDENRIVGTSAGTSQPKPGAGQAFSTASSTTALNRDSDKLPVAIGGSSWVGGPYVAEFLYGTPSASNVSFGQQLYNDYTGTWGVGGSATFAVTPQFTVGGGVAYVMATEDNGVFGDSAVEIDGGVQYSLNANLALSALAGYILPDSGDDVWAVTIRTIFNF